MTVLIPVHGRWTEEDEDETPSVGAVWFAAELRRRNTETVTIKLPGARGPIELDGNGEISLDLPATDDPDITPAGWAWRVTERIQGHPVHSWLLEVPAATVGTLELAEQSPLVTPPSLGTVITQGELNAAVAAHDAADDPHGDRAYADALVQVQYISTTQLGCTGVTDDTALVQAAIDAAGSDFELVIDCPVLLDEANSVGGVGYALTLSGDNIVVRCTPHGLITRTATSGAVFWAHGSGKPSGPASWLANRYTSATVYGLTGSVAKGAASVTCSTPGDAANFAPGDFLYLVTGQLTANAITGWREPDAECFRVVSVNAGTGVITLDRPTGKAFAQEYYPTSTGGISTTTPTAWPAPYGISKVTDRTISNVRFRDLRMDTAATDRNAISAWQVHGLVIENCQGQGNGLQTGRDMTGVRISGNRWFCNQTAATMTYHVAAASGSADFTCRDNVIHGAGFRYAHIHEGVVRPRLLNETYLFSGGGSSDKAVDFAARVYDAELVSPAVGVCGYAVFVDGTCTGGGVIRNVRFIGAIGTSSIRMDATSGWAIDQSDVPNGAVSLLPSGGAVGPNSVHVISGWVGPSTTPSSLTRTLGALPAEAIIMQVRVLVETAFSGGSSPTLTVGIDGDTTRYMGAYSNLASAGLVTAAATPAPGSTTNGVAIPSRQTARAYITGTPTAGRALVAVKYALGAHKH